MKKRKRNRPVFLWLNKRGQTSPVQEASQCQNRQGSIFSFQLPEPLKKPIMDINKSKYIHKRKSLTLSKKKNQIIFKKSTKLSQKNPNIQNPLILDLKGHKTGRKIVKILNFGARTLNQPYSRIETFHTKRTIIETVLHKKYPENLGFLWLLND